MAVVKCAAFIVAGFVAVDRPREGLDERYALNQGDPRCEFGSEMSIPPTSGNRDRETR